MESIYNDDYCDLPDGSDETRTSACSHLSVRFQCLGVSCQEISIPTSRVNDGICDCGDGSDEWDSRYITKVCPNRCWTKSLSSPQPIGASSNSTKNTAEANRSIVTSAARTKRSKSF